MNFDIKARNGKCDLYLNNYCICSQLTKKELRKALHAVKVPHDVINSVLGLEKNEEVGNGFGI